MFGTGARAYTKVGLETDILNADPHRLVLILFEGVIQCVARAQSALRGGDVMQRNRHLVKAVQLVDEGLRVAVDPSHDPEFAGRLTGLYQYVTMRLLQANVRGDGKALDEAERILTGLRDAWVRIAPAAGAARATDAIPQATAPAPVETVMPAARRAAMAYQV